jgi:hypothetical protein
MNISKVDAKEGKLEGILKGLDYFLSEILVKNLFLPGQVENWVFIMDFKNSGISDLPLKSFKNIISYMSAHYKFRLYRLYVVNCTKGITVPWKGVSVFLEDDTVKKINFTNDSVPETLKEIAHPS